MLKFLLIALLTLLPVSAKADLFDPGNDFDQLLDLGGDVDIKEKITPEAASVYKVDSTGATLRSGVDFDPKGGFRRPLVMDKGIVSDLNIGCGRFDYSLNWLNTFTAEALKDYVVDVGSNVIAASPLLLLTYISPTYADVLEKLKRTAKDRLELPYYTCEQIYAELAPEQKTSRAEAAKEQLEDSDPSDITGGIENLKDATYADYKDYKGNKRGSREFKLVKEGLEWVKTPEEYREIADQIAAELITHEKEKKTPSAEKELAKFDSDRRTHYYREKIIEALNKTLVDDLRDIDLERISTRNVKFTRGRMSELTGMSKQAQERSINIHASNLAMAKTNEAVEIISSNLIAASKNQYIAGTEKEFLKKEAERLKGKMASLERRREAEEKVQEQAALQKDVIQEENQYLKSLFTEQLSVDIQENERKESVWR